MADLNGTNFIIRAKRGVVADLNTTEHKSISYLGELAYTTDTNELYIFDGTEYVLAVDLSGLVPYTGATSTLNLGDQEIHFYGGGEFGGIRDSGTAFQILTRSNNALIEFVNQLTNYNAIFDFSLIDSSDKTVTIPNATGTLAMETAVSDTFTTVDGKTVTVVNGIITSIV